MQLETCRILQCWSRILVPFQLRRTDSGKPFLEAGEIAQAFRDHSSGWVWNGPAADGLADGADFAKAAHSRYMLEYLEHAVKFLFDGTGRTGCHYLRVAMDPYRLQDSSRSIWSGTGLEVTEVADGRPNRPSPRGLELLAGDGPWKKSQPPAAAGDALRLAPLPKQLHAEIWLSRLGLGVLSIPLMIEPADESGAIDLAALCDLHHALATGQKYVWLASAVGVAGKVGTPAPSAALPSGGGTHFHELARQLLVPLKHLGRLACDRRGLVYAVLKLAAPQAGAADEAVRGELLGGLSHLAQLYPSGHPGGPSREAGLRLNDEHLTVIDLGGAAHATLVRPEYRRAADEEFAKKARPERCHFEFFPGYLLAVLQRMCLQDLLNRATVEVSRESSRDDLEAIRRDALAFSLEGEFIQVSWRGSVQRFHESAQRVCEVQQGLQTVRDSLDGFDRMSRAREAEDREAESLRSERNMQMLEAFLVSVYAVSVAHYLGQGFGFSENLFMGYSLLGVLATTIVAVVGQMTRDKPPDPKRRRPGIFAWAGWPLVGTLLLIHAVFLGLNFWFNAPQGH